MESNIGNRERCIAADAVDSDFESGNSFRVVPAMTALFDGNRLGKRSPPFEEKGAMVFGKVRGKERKKQGGETKTN